ncbi:MAG: hypothetical protein KUG77_07475 [Nannocystaceae bacterium]|nr:hypothetical protein [Nannocystaceae bacterium]
MRIRTVLAAYIWLLASGCDENPPTAVDASSTGATVETASEGSGPPANFKGTAPLIDLGAFEKTAATDDPFDDRPSDIACEFGFGLEDGFFEFESDLCRYGAFSQPALAPIRSGDTVDFLLLHENLVSSEPGSQAHVAIAFGDEIAYEARIDIPAEADFLDEQWVSTLDVPEGTPVHFHLHNHGINSYRLAELAVTYAD